MTEVKILGSRRRGRAQALCASCGGPIAIGQREHEVEGTGWVHDHCMIKMRDGTWAQVYGVPADRRRRPGGG